jgi:hypothetical protein
VREALSKLAQDKRFVGSNRIGYLAVLHAWGNTLQYHPHLHLVIPGGRLIRKSRSMATVTKRPVCSHKTSGLHF